ncbi:3-hydroxyacyl-CoA dehydrogenase NAD-binding domain-containing protein [Paralimibaculum aggregatum]|uniref:3-hydroxyacyl-CoA dehydrogenase NAD-binding domain-containing protein n=1 Tax=Paralimibaculum aggregatum TaxID=3036245 RepID=A0ABQ6LFL2_9RHOB|nr:3-hydroxyacyl-CoA dehydrogenase NAD-binding domain-containing protein [Limibaculum sp. NKW23]GMG82110.1 3-hydroxyacyl-CoA dehydrogenase NAD-binding domain-containing protein [Limibaculum sp. NKW23]
MQGATETGSGTGDAVSLEMIGEIAVVTVDSPPANTLSHSVRKGLFACVGAALADQHALAVVVICAGRTFIAGAEISEFGKPRQPPPTAEVVAMIEAAGKPVIAAIHGTALGGGLEFAMGCHYRVALADAKLGLPEIDLGILPGGGGTQRLPRLVGAEAALEMMLTGRHVPAAEAEAMGLIDAVFAGGEQRAAGLAFARRAIAEGLPPRPTRAMVERITREPLSGEAVERALARHARKHRGLAGPRHIADCVKAAMELPFEAGLRIERERFEDCMKRPERAALMHAFLAERKARKIPDIAGIEGRPVRRAGVIGGGTMGAGIAVSLLDAGIAVTLLETDAAALDRARGNIRRIHDRAIARGRMTEAGREALLAERCRLTLDHDALGEADLVIEAAFEDMAVKKAIFARLDAVARPGAVLATNTSRLDVDEIAAATARPEDVIGMHFFSPAHVMRLVEIVVGRRTAPEVIATAFDLAKRLGKVGVRSGVCDGFIGNRMLSKYKIAADRLVEDGVSPFDLDRAVVGFGYPMGPYQMGDLAGLDISWAARKRQAATRDPAERYVAIADRICERGWFGQKTGRGYYIYDDASPRGRPNPDVAEIVARERAAKGIVSRSVPEAEIVEQLMAALVNEGARILADGIALRPLDIDVTLMLGYGFPRWRGGPMKHADMIGLETVLGTLRRNAASDPAFWRPAPLLEHLVAEGRPFESLNQ